MGFPWISMLHGGFRKVMGVPPKSSISLGLSRSQKHHPLLAWGTPMTSWDPTHGFFSGIHRSGLDDRCHFWEMRIGPLILLIGGKKKTA